MPHPNVFPIYRMVYGSFYTRNLARQSCPDQPSRLLVVCLSVF